MDTKQYEAALEQFARLSQRAPGNADVRYAYGLLLLQTNHPEEAEVQFKELIARRERLLTSVSETLHHPGRVRD